MTEKIFTKECSIVTIFLAALIESMEEGKKEGLSIEELKSMKKDFEVQALR